MNVFRWCFGVTLLLMSVRLLKEAETVQLFVFCDLEKLKFGKVLYSIFNICHSMFSFNVDIILFYNAFNVFLKFSLSDERSVSNAYNVSDVELNPYLPEVETFRSL